jgi:hypothetical protein
MEKGGHPGRYQSRSFEKQRIAWIELSILKRIPVGNCP